MLGLLTPPRQPRLATALVVGATIIPQKAPRGPNVPYRKPVETAPVFTPPPAPRTATSSRVVTLAAFDHPKTYAEFLEREPRYIRNFLKSRKCHWSQVEDFEQSLHLHLMTPPGPKSVHYGKADKLATYAPSKMGGIGTRWAWAKYLNTILSNEYGKLIKRGDKGGVRGENVITLSVPLEENTILTPQDREKFLDHEHKTLISKVVVRSFLSRVRERHGEELYVFAKNLLVYDTATEAGAAMGISSTKALGLQRKLIAFGERFARRR